MSPPRAVLIDRDGVINRNHAGYVKSIEEMEILPGALEALALLSESGHRIFVVTNQSAIGRGLMTTADVNRLHEHLASNLREHGGTIEAFLVCPHRPEDGCECRKPAPGLFYQARDRYGVDLRAAYAIGDAYSDIAAARAAGCTTVLVLSGLTTSDTGGIADHTVRDLGHAARLIIGSH